MRSKTRCAAWSPAGLLPERAGQPVKVWAHVSLAELRALDDGSVLQDQWIGEMTIRWAARRAAASAAGGDGGAWLNGASAGAVACDATIIPVVTGQVDPAALDDLVGLCLQFAGHGPHCGSPQHPDSAAQPGPTAAQPGAAAPAGGPDPVGDAARVGPRSPTPQALEMLRHAIIGKAVNLVSGPGSPRRIDAPGTVRFASYLGQREYPHCTSAGKALLTALEPEQARVLAVEAGMPPRTERTITDLDDLLRDLELSAARGSPSMMRKTRQACSVWARRSMTGPASAWPPSAAPG